MPENLVDYIYDHIGNKRIMILIDMISKRIFTKYKSSISILGSVLFGEKKTMVDIIQSGTSDAVTMLDYYYTGSDEDQK